MGLTPKQAEAVGRTGQDVCVVAGPGSGKTRVLVERFVWLIRERGGPPSRILTITFTEKAATEIKQRLAREFSTNSELREQVERAYVSTVHGFCARLLREHPIAAGLDPEFQVLEGAESSAELQEAAEEALDSVYQSKPGQLRELLEALHVSTWSGGRQQDMAEALCEIYEAMRIAGVSLPALRAGSVDSAGGLSLTVFLDELRHVLASAPAQPTPKQTECIDALREWATRADAFVNEPASRRHFELLEQYPSKLPTKVLPDLKSIRDERLALFESTLAGEFYAPLKSILLDVLELTNANYRRRKGERAALDFSDLEERAIDLLRGDAHVLASVRESFDQILMDELQDTNPLQWKLMDLLRRPRKFFAVGDINQSIFGFRHADPDVFRRYRESVGGADGVIDELYENFRSRGEILAAVEAIAGRTEGVEKHRLRPARSFLQKEQPSVEVIAGFESGETAAEDMEARWIARRIVELVGTLPVQDGEDRQRPACFRDMAVLVRTGTALAPVVAALQEFGVPHLAEGGRTFYETREVRDLVHLLQTIANPENELALAGVLRSPLVGAGDETLLRMKQQTAHLARALSSLDALGAASCDAEDLERLRRFAALLASLRRERDDVSPDRLLMRAMDACDYESGLDARQRANVAKFLVRVRERHSAKPEPLDALLADIEWLRAAAAEAEAPPGDSSDVVRIMTMHKSKGLEFPVVFLPALHRGTGGAGPSIRLSPEGSLGAWWRNPVTGQGMKDLSYRRTSELLTERECREENRLLYVAMTRAEEHLVLSFARTSRPQGENWKLVRDGLGLNLDAADNQAIIFEAGVAGIPVRVLRTDQAPGLLSVPVEPGVTQAEPMVLARPTLSDQHDSAAPVTSIQLFAQCPRRYYLGRYIGWDRLSRPVQDHPEETPWDWDEPHDESAAEFGTVVHALLAGEPVDTASAEALDLVQRFETSELGQRVSRASRVEREFDFVMAIEDVVLRGQIDLWFEEGGELLLLDYKTDAVRPEEAASRAAAYAVQLRLYALALERITGRMPSRTYACFLRPGQTIPIAMDKPFLEETKDLVRLFREAQSSLRFDLREGEQCGRCPYYQGPCPAGRPV
jgi:ATP-dependent exoDNAse (exonuclease V) beta subunit